MNPKSRLSVKYAKSVIEVNTIFAKMMENPRSDEYELLQKIKMENPGFTVSRRQIKSNPKKDTYKGLTYERMEEYITKYAANEDRKKADLAELEKMIDISKCHGMAYRYPTIKKWFLAKYPEVAKFGLVEAEAQNNSKKEEQFEESKSQNTVPVNEVPHINDVQTPAVNVLQ